MGLWFFALLTAACLISVVSSNCLGGGSEQAINLALSSAGTNGKVQLCPGSVFTINNAVTFTADGQELSTEGYPTGSTRATVQINAANGQLLTAVQGTGRSNIKLLNVIVEGNRPSTWTVTGGFYGLVEVGGTSTGAKISGTWIRNTRSQACLRLVTGSTSPPYGCTNVDVSNNVIGPCGNRQAGSSIAHGIASSCAQSQIANNQIVDFTNIGIIMFGTPGTKYTGNTLNSPAKIRAYAGIMTSGGYDNNFSGVSVTNNRINGGQMINIGLGIGSGAGGGAQPNEANFYSGPATFTGNSFTGNIVVSVGVGGWKNGLVVDSISTSTTKPNSKFADAVVGQPSYDCADDYVSWKIFYQNIPLWYYSPDIRGTYKIGTNFKDITFGRPSNMYCYLPLIASSTNFTAGSLSAVPGQRISYMHNGVALQYQTDNRIVAISYANPDSSTVLYDSGTAYPNCGSSSTTQCKLVFDSTGVLTNYVGSTALFRSNSGGTSGVFQTLNQSPWFVVRSGGSTGQIVWTSSNVPRFSG